MSSPALLSLQQELRRSLEVLGASRPRWDRALAECEPLLGTLGNLALQLKALNSVRLEDTPLTGFIGLQDRLQYKLSLAVDAVLGKLAEKMADLQSVREAVGQRVSAVFQVYEQNADALDIEVCVSRSSLCPSVADMLEWLQDADRFFHLQLIQRRTLLQTLTPDDLTLMETAPKRWASLRSAAGEQRIADALCHVSFFMETE